MELIIKKIILLGFLSLYHVGAHEPEDCNQPVAQGDCKGQFPKYFYNSSSSECEQFYYTGCKGNGNNFVDMKECEEHCVKAVPEPLMYQESLGEILLVLDADKDLVEDLTNFEDEQFGKWIEDNMEIVSLQEVPEKNGKVMITRSSSTFKKRENLELASARANESNSTESGSGSEFGSESESVSGPDSEQTTEDDNNVGEGSEKEPEPAVGGGAVLTDNNGNNSSKYVAAPQSSLVFSHDNGTLSRTIQVGGDWHHEISLALKVVKYQAQFWNSTNNENPEFSIELVRLEDLSPRIENGEENSETEEPTTNNVINQMTLFDIKNYGRFFETKSEWLTLRFVIPLHEALEGTYDLTLTSKRGNTENSNIFLDNLKFTSIRRLNVDRAKEIDSETPEVPAAGSGQEENQSQFAKFGTLHIVLIVIVVILAMALVFVSLKYWSLKNELSGKYSVSVNSQQRNSDSMERSNPAYENEGGYQATRSGYQNR